jgi:hypothetical protein
MKSQVHECCSSAILSLARKMVSFSHNSRNVNLFEIQIIQVKLDLDINYDFSCNPAPLQGPTGTGKMPTTARREHQMSNGNLGINQ